MKTIFYTALFLLVSIQTVYSQDKNLYSFITVDTNYLTTEQEARWNRIHSNDMYESFYFVEMTDFVRNNEYDGVLNTQLPDSSVLTYNFKYVTDRPDQLIWYGEFQTLVDTIASWGDLLYIDDESGKFGTFSNEHLTYELIDLSGDLQVLAVIDTSINYGECGMSELESFNNQIISSRDPEPCPIRVLATYTEEAASKVASIEQTAKLDIEYANATLKNSHISELQGFFVYIGNIEAPSSYEYTNDDPDADRMELMLDINLKELQETHEADLMIVYVAPAWSLGEYARRYGFAGEFGVASNFPEDPNFSFVAYDIKSTIREKTFAHEAGHVMGARHQEQDDPNGEFEHAHSFGAWVKGPPPSLLSIPIKVRSMVWGGGPKRPRMPHYSNPDVEFLEKPTGTESRNNALQIRMEACSTSNIKATTIPFSIFIEGPIQVEPLSTYNFEAFVYGGQSPFEYDWYISFNGIDFQSLNDFNEVHSLPINSPVGTFIILKVEVTDDNDITRMGFLTIRVSEDEIQGFQISQVGSILSYVPNPATNQIDVTIEVLREPKSELTLQINDSNGNLIQNLGQKITTKGIHTLRIHIDSIPSGIMFIGLYDGRTVEDIKIILKI